METKPTLQTPIGEQKWEREREQSAPPPRQIQYLSLAIAEFMLWLSLTGEKRSSRRTVRKAIIMDRWMQLSGDVLKAPFPGVLLL